MLLRRRVPGTEVCGGCGLVFCTMIAYNNRTCADGTTGFHLSNARGTSLNPASVFLVHDHTLFREGLRHNLNNVADFVVAGEAHNGQQTIQLVSQIEPDIVVLSIDLPGVSGLEVARVIKRSHPHISIVLLSSSIDSQQVVKAIRVGVAAYVPLNVTWEDILETLRDVRRGNFPINNLVLTMPNVASQVLNAFREMAAEEDSNTIYSPLSPRELQVLELVAIGQTNKEIALSLDISNQTVKNHISSILRKLAVNDRTHAVVYAIRRGWIKASLPSD